MQVNKQRVIKSVPLVKTMVEILTYLVSLTLSVPNFRIHLSSAFIF